MEHNHKLFKKYLPIIIILSLVSLVFGLFALAYSYNSATASVKFDEVIPICWLAFIAISVIVAIVFSFKLDKKPHINRIKKSSSLSKFATLLAAGLVTALFLFNFIQFVQLESSLPTFKLIRLAVSVPFIAYLVIGIIPKTIRRKKIEIPKWIVPIAALGAVAWCISSLLAIYFWEGASALPTTNFFRLTHMFYLALATVFFLTEVGFEVFSKGHRLYVFTSTCLFIVTVTLTGSLMIAKFLGKLPEITISEFEIFVGVALGIYALSKLFAIQHTLQHVMKQKSDGTGRHHHHHRHRHHKSEENVTTISSSDIPQDIDI